MPGGELQLRFLGRHAVGLADLADELLAVAADAVELVARQPAPARPRVQLVFAPVALDALPVHGCLIPSEYGVRLCGLAHRCAHGRELPSPDETITAAPRMRRRPGRDAEARAATDAAPLQARGRA